MPGCKPLTLDAVRAVVAALPESDDFKWDGLSEDDRPATEQELAKARRGRPRLPLAKRPLTVRYDADVIEAFKATGPGWQTRMNDALREWLQEHGTV